MIGDMSPFRSQSGRYSAGGQSPPTPPGPRGAALLYPTVRNFKIDENMSPRPEDRVFYDFNYYNDLNAAVNARSNTQITNMNAYVHMFGFEKTFNEGKGSLGMRLPLDTLTADSPNNNISTPTTTALSNLTMFVKYILAENKETDSLISVGMALTPPTGTSRFAGAPYVSGFNTTYFQPFIGFVWNRDRLYVEGFSALDIPASNEDVNVLYNDVGIGYYIYRANDKRSFLSSVAPAFEVHVNTPLNHRNPFNTFDPAAAGYSTDLTYGINFGLSTRAMLTAALVTPVSSPKPFDVEATVFINFFFGRSAREAEEIQPPVIQ